MAELSYLKLTNNTTGEAIAGDSLDTGFAEQIEVVAFSQDTERPTHPQSGVVTGETTYGPLTVLKPVDRASPLLQMGLAQGNKFTGAITFLRTGSDGQREHWYTIEFEDASLVGIKMYKPQVIKESESKYPDLEEISFRFVRIIWRHEKASIEATADWSER